MSTAEILVGNEAEDFDWIYKLSGKDKDYLLGPVHPIELRDALKKGEMLITSDHTGFCEIHFSQRTGYVTIYKIFIQADQRGKGYAKKFIAYIKEHYDYPIKTTCMTGTSSESFWSHVAKKVEDKFTRKGTPVSVYVIGEPVKTIRKEVLF